VSEEKCYNCFRPKKTCYCKYIVPVETGIKFVFLMHPKEAYHQKTGTGRLAALSLPGSEIIIGIDFTENKRVKEILENPDYFPVLMYPDENAWSAEKMGFHEVIGNKTLVIFLVDATWFFAKKMLRLSPILHTIPKFSFRAGYRSQYEFKTQPAPECLSTIETCYYVIKELQEKGIAKKGNPEPLMNVFHKMIDYQLESEKARINLGIPNRYIRENRNID
jgi:DTW domain-containing protein YfiP